MQHYHHSIKPVCKDTLEQIYFLSLVSVMRLTARDMNREHLAMTITGMDAGVEPPWMADICSSAIAPALFYYLSSMAVCIALISYIHVTMQYLHFLHPCRSFHGASLVSIPGPCLELKKIRPRLRILSFTD